MKQKIKILLLEDMKADVELIEMELNNANIEFDNILVDTKKEFITALNQFTPDIILADHSVASFNSMEALKIAKENGVTSPFLIVTTAISETSAKSAIEEGASDYVLKDKLYQLPDAIKNALGKYTFEDQERLVTDTISLEEKLYDLSLLEEMDDSEYIVEIVSIFLNETPKELAEMKKAAMLGEFEIVGKKAHKVKSSAGLLQANGLLQTLKQIEAISSKGDANEIVPLVEDANKKYKKIEVALSTYLKSIPS
jgi:CheY-like chemotaxis protein